MRTFSPEGPIILTAIERMDLEPHDVLIEIMERSGIPQGGYTGTNGAIDNYGQYTQGGYSTHVIVLAAEPMGSCSDKKVAVTELGGLGHMAV